MNNSLIMTLIALSLLLAGCAESSLVVAKPGASLPGGEVSVYYIDRPRCNFETIAHIRVTGGYFSLESMVSKMRRQAAEAGASGLYVLQTQRLETKEFLGTAKAIRCLPA